VPHAVDEECGRAGHAGQVGRVHIFGHVPGPGVAAQVGPEPVQVQVELFGVVEQVPDGQRALVVQQQVVHGPELVLDAGRLGGLGRELGVRVHVGEGQVPPHVADVAEVAQQLADHWFGPAAVGALEVAVLDHGHRGGGRAAQVVAARVDRHGQVGDGVGRAQQGQQLQPLGQPGHDLEHRPAQPGRHQHRGQHPELGLLERVATEGQ
jgi:hypothetical protein